MDLVEPKNQSEQIADPFAKMADLVRHNAGQPFGGAFVIVGPAPPNQALPDPITSLFLNAASEGMFWATLKSICQQRIDEIDTEERKMRGAFGR